MLSVAVLFGNKRLPVWYRGHHVTYVAPIGRRSTSAMLPSNPPTSKLRLFYDPLFSDSVRPAVYKENDYAIVSFGSHTAFLLVFIVSRSSILQNCHWETGNIIKGCLPGFITHGFVWPGVRLEHSTSTKLIIGDL